MSRGHHRKSQSTSALSIIAQGQERHIAITPALGKSVGLGIGMGVNPSGGVGPSSTPVTGRNEIARRSLAAVEEAPGSSERRQRRSKSSDRDKGKEREKERRADEPSSGKDRAETVDDVKLWLGELRSLRSSTRRRGAAMRRLERSLLDSCEGTRGVPLSTFIDLKPHDTLLSLLSRHTATLTRRAPTTSLPTGDEAAVALSPEIEGACSVLQGLCLLSRRTKEEVGERWVIEMFIDLLLLLRTQPGLGERRPVTYGILDLLFCVLVDRPDHARTFEIVGGLEAVTRVLKGSGVAKEIRMKCIEFLYFYLLPENSGKRSASGSSTSSASSSGSSVLYPSSPLNASVSELPTALGVPGFVSSAESEKPRARSPTSQPWSDLDLPFVPQTPRKPVKPALGFLTPSTRRVSTASSSATPVLPSPANASHRLSMGPPTDRRESYHLPSTRAEAGVGLGFGLPRDDPSFSDPFAKAMTRTSSSQSASTTGSGSGSGGSISGAEGVSAGDARSTSSGSGSASGSGSGSANSSVTVVPASPNAQLPRLPTPTSGETPGSSRLSRSSTQPSLAGALGGRGRQTSRRVSRSPLVNSITATPESPESRMSTPDAGIEAATGSERRRIHHSRTQSALSALAHPSPAPVASTSSSQEALGVRRPSTKPRGFPSELTRGILPSASSPSLASMASSPSLSSVSVISSSMSSRPVPRTGERNITPTPMPKGVNGVNGAGGVGMGPTPLGATRVVSGSQSMRNVSVSSVVKDKGKQRAVERVDSRGSQGERSVAEKKEMLGIWLGNVDQLVQGVERTGFWGSLGKKERGEV